MALETGEEDSNQFVLQFSQRLQRRRAEKEAGYLFASLTPTNAAAAAAAAAAAGSSRTQAPPPAMSTPGLTRVDWSAVRNTELRGFKNGPSLVLDLEREDYMKREKAFLRAETDRKAREQAAAQEEQEHADSDSSAEWTREKKDRLLVENAKKHYTKSRRIKENSERCHTSQIQTIDRLADQEDMGGYVDWEKMDDPDYDVLTQMSHYKPVALHIARHMDVCFPPLNKEFEVKITSYKDGSFYCNWPEIEKELHDYEILINKHTRQGGGVRGIFAGDVVLVRAGCTTATWTRALVRQVFRRQKCIEVYLMEYGPRVIRLSPEDITTMLEDDYALTDRGRVFLTCRFHLTGHDPKTVKGQEESKYLERMAGERVRILCTHVLGRRSFGRMWVSDGRAWHELPQCIAPTS